MTDMTKQTEAEREALTSVPDWASEAKEQPAQQEPVAWMYQCSADSSGPVLMQNKRDWAESSSGLWTETPLYTSPPAQRKPLTDKEIYKVFPAIATYTEANKTLYRSIARAIEAAHGIKGDA